MQGIETKRMPEYDVIVVGGGVAGVAAAVAASRNGAKTLLMEKTVILGGLATIGLINWYEPLCDGEGNQMVTGIAEELIKLSVKYGFESLPEKWGGEGKYPPRGERYATFFSPNIFALALIEYLGENGVSLRLDTLATYPDVEDGICKGILVETIGGREYFPTKMVVDATGDACICHRAGIPTELGDNYFSYITHEMDDKDAEKLAETGDFRIARKWKSAGSDMFGNGQPEGKKAMQVSTADDVTEYIVWGGKKVLNRLKLEDKNSREVVSIPAMPQFRKIRRIIGEVEFDGSEDGIAIADSVGTFGDFRKAGRYFQLPYASLYNKKVGNLFAAGRVISAKDDGWELTRVIPVAALSGEAAGTAAALCVKETCGNHELDVKILQKSLKEAGVKFQLNLEE
ncbi:MAG: FAD-dependent oxidoreductase [Tyzzerella sp.]|nr:FAD-dependent oxidoreductase [Tyzzerella sp.]